MRARFSFAVGAALAGIGLSFRPLLAGGTSAGQVLLRSPSARSLAIGEAVSSFGSDFEGVTNFHYNPAASVYLRNPEASLMGQRGFAEDNYGALFLGFPIERGTIAGSLLYYNAGEVELIDSRGASSTVTSEQDLGIGLNYGEEIFERIATGLTVKFLNSKLAGSLSANAVAFDLGLQSRFLEKKLALGAALLNAGSDLTYLDVSEPLPMTVRGGASYRIDLETQGRIYVSGDVLQQRDESARAFLGADFLWNELLGFRLGYKIGKDEGHYAAGLGFALGRFRLDYALGDAGSLGWTHSFSLNYRFGQVEPEKRTASYEDSRLRAILRQRQSEAKNKPTLAVLELRPQGVLQSEAAILTDTVQTAFVKRQKAFTVIERREIERLLQEQYRHFIACTEVQCAVEIGKQLEAQKVVMGTLGKLGTIYVLNLRVVNVSDGRLDAAETIKTFGLSEMEPRIRKWVNSLSDSGR